MTQAPLPMLASLASLLIGISGAEAMTIPPGAGDLEIDYTATSLSAPERVQFRYRLEGEDRMWRDVGTRRRVYYTGLRPGMYTFRVIASNGDPFPRRLQ